MKLYSYCIPIDDGAAPNPFWGVCTLTICKPVIRRVAEVGDWIVGVGSKNALGKDYSGKLVYAMKVTEKLSLRKYDERCKILWPDKIPDIANEDYRMRVGDCIYDFEGGYRPILRAGVHCTENIERDLRGENALLSHEFYYFGDKAEDIPKDFRVLIRQGQGHQSTRNQFIKHKFVDWLQSNFEKCKLYGNPQIQIEFKEDYSGNICAKKRCSSAEEDELVDYSDEALPLSHWNYFLALESDLKTLSRYVELHESNYKVFSIGLTQIFLAACSECEIVMKGVCKLLTGKDSRNMEGFSKGILSEMPLIKLKSISIPLYNIKLSPFKDWTDKTPMDWWRGYNNVKHHRNTHFAEANLKNTINALGALYILIFELVRLHKGKEDGTFDLNFIYKLLQPRQELFLLDGEDLGRDIAEGKTLWPG